MGQIIQVDQVKRKILYKNHYGHKRKTLRMPKCTYISVPFIRNRYRMSKLYLVRIGNGFTRPLTPLLDYKC